MNGDKLREAIMKVALGYTVGEVTEEYGVENGQLRLLKRKETRKDVPPDLKAVKLLSEETDYSSMTDEELEREKRRLLQKLSEEKEDTSD